MLATDALLEIIAATSSDAGQQRLIALMGLGFFVGVFGHLVGSRAVVAIGVVVFFTATFLLPLILYA